ncbi:uncharacterized protein Dyak_GE25651 [Drosophila yakuba]|uniref:Gustatory receptor n=1 Tax=Drosophila yakuba TaxID=7245 RepID=B4PP71_DROYA|nr:uncharacterized protein Dyak_GE25651 [Drosophila yakuba]
MFEFLHLMSAPKLSTGILRYNFRYAQFIGAIFFCLHNKKDGETVFNHNWLKWLNVTHRILTFCRFFWLYLATISMDTNVQHILYGMRLLLSIPNVVIILVYQIVRGQEIIDLVNQFLHLFRKVNDLFQPKTPGFGGRRELILILLNLISFAHEQTYLWFTVRKVYSWRFFFNWWCDFYVVSATNMFIHINFIGYLSLGVLYSEVNKYVYTNLQIQLQKLNTSSSQKKIRRVQNRLEKCISLYREIYNTSVSFHKLFVLPLFLALIYKFALIALIGRNVAVEFYSSSFVFWILLLKHVLDLFLVTVSVQGAVNQYLNIGLEFGNVGELSKFQTTLDILFIHLRLCHFRVSILGLFDVTNKLFLKFISALISLLAFIAQYKMQKGKG